MACCLLVAMMIARLRRALGLGDGARSRGPSLGLLLGVAVVELGTAWAIARGLTAPGTGHQHGGSGSHLVLMTQLVALGVLVPLVLALLLPASDPQPRPGARRQLFAAAVAAPTVMWLWHLPDVHGAVEEATGEIVRAISVLVTGYVFWRCVLGTGHRVAPPAARQIALVLAGQANALLGLALLLTTDPMHGGTDGFGGLSVVADQRLAGLLMLVVDLGVMIPLLARLDAARRANPAPPVQLRMPPAVQP
ncbi:hypothetical protein GCM10009547_18700 [Sporichthya brevicatena]|uniref:Cytochrome c oxidase assembly protein n=1 Tax=Sporichthya brevicatena TaxID=171442 RepID=A0ABN1GQW1_9ACTN